MSDNKYKHTDHLTYLCRYHVVFCPKYRRKVLINGVDERLKEIISEVSKECDFDVLELEVMPDHVHLLIDCNPRFGITRCVKRIKGRSSNLLRKEFPWLKSKLPCLWSSSAFIASVGSVSLDVVKKYIQNQLDV